MHIIPLPVNEDVTTGDDIGKLILQAASANGVSMQNHDVVVITQKIISKSEGRMINLSTIKPSNHAFELASKTKKDPRFIELVLIESKSIVRYSENVIVTETKHGFVCANAGIDQSNVSDPGNDFVLLLPVDPDLSARRIKEAIAETIGMNIAVVISDTFGRPFRLGQTNVAIGVSGINSIKSI